MPFKANIYWDICTPFWHYCRMYCLGVIWFCIVIIAKASKYLCVIILRWCLQCVRLHHHAVNPVNCFSHTNTQTKVWWHHVFSTPAVAMLLCNNGLMEQLQTLLASSSSPTSPSGCAPSALLCYSHLLLSSLLTLQHFHSTKVPTNIKLCIFCTEQRQKQKFYDLKNRLVWDLPGSDVVIQNCPFFFWSSIDWIFLTCNMMFVSLSAYLFSLAFFLFLRSKGASIGIWRKLCSDCLFKRERLTMSF